MQLNTNIIKYLNNFDFSFVILKIPKIEILLFYSLCEV